MMFVFRKAQNGSKFRMKLLWNCNDGVILCELS